MRTKRFFITLGYLLWAVAFIPTAALAAVLTALPWYAMAYWFHWSAVAVGIVGFYLYGFLCAAFYMFCFYPEPINPMECYLSLIGMAGAIGGAFFMLCCFGLVRARETVLTVVTLLALLLVAAAAAVSIVRFVKSARKTFRARFGDTKESNRRIALEKLPYPEERETLVKAALEDKDRDYRRIALKKLPYPEERETLIKAALEDEDRDNRRIALEKLPYPEERETLLAACSSMEHTLVNITYKDDELADTLRRLYKKCGISKTISFSSRVVREVVMGGWEDVEYEYVDMSSSGASGVYVDRKTVYVPDKVHEEFRTVKEYTIHSD